MKRLPFICLIAVALAQEAPKPVTPLPAAAGQEATRQETQQRLGELMAFAATTGAQGDAMRRELQEAEMARSNRSFTRDAELNRLTEKSAAGDEAATKRIAELRKEKEADDEEWKQLRDKQIAFAEALEGWNLELELAAASVLKGKGVLESGEGLTSIKANLGRGSLVYRWQGPAERGKPEMEVKFTFLPMPPDAMSRSGNPTRKIGGRGTVIMEREHMAGVFFGKFQMSVELGHWKEGDKAPLEVAAQVIDFDALGALEVAMAGAEPAKLDRKLPRVPLEVKRPPGSTQRREEQLKALGGFLREAFELKKRIAEMEEEESEERNRLSLRLDETGADALSDEIDRLRRRARAGEAGLEKAIAEANAKRTALVEKESAPLRAMGEKKAALLHEAELKNPRFAAVAAAMLNPSALPDGVGLAKIDADLGKGTLWLHWDTQPGSKQPAVTMFLQLFHRPAGFEQANPVKAMLHDRWPVIIDAPNNTRIWLQEIQVDLSVSPEWQARGILPKDLAKHLLDDRTLGKLDAATSGKP